MNNIGPFKLSPAIGDSFPVSQAFYMMTSGAYAPTVRFILFEELSLLKQDLINTESYEDLAILRSTELSYHIDLPLPEFLLH